MEMVNNKLIKEYQIKIWMKLKVKFLIYGLKTYVIKIKIYHQNNKLQEVKKNLYLQQIDYFNQKIYQIKNNLRMF